MLEIILIWTLAKKIGNIVQEKGHSRFGYQFLFVVLWIGGEITGAIVGALVQGASDSGEKGFPCVGYLFALAGAACGAGLGFLIANSLSNLNSDADYYRDDDRRRPGDDARQSWRMPRDRADRGDNDQITDRPPPRREDDRIQE